MTALTEELTALPHPAPPPELAKAVLARIERIETTRGAAAAPAANAAHEMSWWLIVACTVAAGLAVLTHGSIALLTMPASVENAVLLAGALVLYAAALFAPLKSRGLRV